MSSTPTAGTSPRRSGARLRIAVWSGSLLCCLAWNVAAVRWDLARTGTGVLRGIDPNYYFAWGRSIAIDGDIDFTNDFAFLAGDERLGATRDHFVASLRLSPPSDNGAPRNKFPLGPGLFSVPAIVLVRLAERMFAWPGGGLDPNSHLYSLAFIATSVVLSFAGLAFCYRLLAGRHSPGIAMASIVAGVLGASLGYYILYEPGMPHAPASAFVTLFLLATVRWSRRVDAGGRIPHRGALLMGLALGVVCLFRFTDAALALVPAAMSGALWFKAPAQRRKGILRSALGSLPASTFGAAMAFMPQLLAWKALYGSPVVYSYNGEPFLAWPQHTHLVLFGAKNGLYFWTPLTLLATLGLARMARRGDGLGVSGLCVIAATAAIYGSWPSYSLGDAFGMRAFVDLSAFFVLGIAESLVWAKETRNRAIPAAIACLVAWNLYFMICYRAEIQPHGDFFAGLELFRHPDKWIEQAGKDTGLGLLFDSR